MLETYITPLLMSYVDKYIKNLKPSDLSLSIWGGDVVLYNLELRLDVIEKELQLPITFLSGKIHKLQIHVPWTKLGSEPVEVTINTLECVIQLRDPEYKPDDADIASSLASVQAEEKSALENSNIHDRGEPPPPGYVQSLINRVSNNISICVQNVILKYVEDDIVLSLNIKSAEVYSVNGDWEKAFVDVTDPEFVLRKVCNISDLTICLDKMSPNGTIDMYQDPLLYRCGLSCRISMNYDSHMRPKETIINVYCECLEGNLTDQQLPMFLRLMKLCISLYYGSLDLPGCNYKPHPAAELIKQNKDISSKRSSTSNMNSSTTPTTSSDTQTEVVQPQDDWLNWVWSFVPETGERDPTKEPRTPAPEVLVTFGIYISQVTLTLKLTEKVSEGTFFGAQRFQFKPIINCELSGVAVEVIIKGDEFFDAQLGVTSIMGWTLGDCVCNHGDDLGLKVAEELVDVDDKEEMFLSIRGPSTMPTEPSAFLTGSLFNNPEQISMELPELEFDIEKFIETHSESYAHKRYGAFFFDYLYTMEIEPQTDTGEGDLGDPLGDERDVGRIRLVKEASHKRILMGPTHLMCTANLIHRLELIYQLSDDGTPPRKEKVEPFYDEFIEKQLLAGNIPSRQFSIILASVTMTVPAADHMKAGSSLHQTPSMQDLLSANLHSIHEQENTADPTHHPAYVMHIDRVELQSTNPMYPVELSKLTMSNADYPAGKSMLHHAYNNTVIKVIGVELSLSHADHMSDPRHAKIMSGVTLIASHINCILPELWGNSILKRNEAHLEVPVLSAELTKPEFLVLCHIANTWQVSLGSQTSKLPVLPKGLLTSVFEPQEKDAGFSKLHLSVSNTELQYCDTSLVMAASGFVGAVELAVHTKGGSLTPLIQGPTDTSLIYTGSIFRREFRDDPAESIGPVVGITVQLPREPDKLNTASGSAPQLKPDSVILLNIKGVVVCLDPLLYDWVGCKPPSPSARTEKDPSRQRGTTLRRTSSVGTPRKKSFARGYGSIASPAKDTKSQQDKLRHSPNDGGGEGTDECIEARTFEAWLYDKLSVITSFALQVDVRSILLFAPEIHVSHGSGARSILRYFNHLSLSPTATVPETLVICLPRLQLLSANHAHIPVRQTLPLHLQSKRDLRTKDTLPWTLNADNLALYSVHAKTSSSGLPVLRNVLSPVSSTAVLASAKTSSHSALVVPHSPTHGFKGVGRADGRRCPTLGFCVHIDFKPVVVSCSRKQILLLSNLVESLLQTVMSQVPVPDVTSGGPSAAPLAPGPPLKRSQSQASSSAVENIEKESLHSDSESSASFTQIRKASHDVRVSLWLQWTLPRFTAHLYGRTSTAHVPTCVTADLEDLTAFIDYQESQLQMQYKVGAFNTTHSVQRESSWIPGPLGGVLFSCKDILSRKSPFASSSRIQSNTESSLHGPHGFLTVIYKRSVIHLKRRFSSKTPGHGGNETQPDKEDLTVEDCFKEQHEVRVNVQPFDVVLFSPAVIAAVDVFDLSFLEKFKFLRETKADLKAQRSETSLEKATQDTDQTITYSVELLPLLFFNMRDVRIFLPSLEKILSPCCESSNGRRPEDIKATGHEGRPGVSTNVVDAPTKESRDEGRPSVSTNVVDSPAKESQFSQDEGRPRVSTNVVDAPTKESQFSQDEGRPRVSTNFDGVPTKESQFSQDDLLVVHLSAISANPHPDNPNSRAVLNKELHEKYRRFGRRSSHALGYDLHDVQYQMEITGLGMWTGIWEELCGQLDTQESSNEGTGQLMDQNPALEWNTKLWRSAQQVHISPLISATDMRIVLAPAVSMSRAITNVSAVSAVTHATEGSVPICSWSLELNITTDVDCYLSTSQIRLLQTLLRDNVYVISNCALLQPPRDSGTLVPQTIPPGPASVKLERSQPPRSAKELEHMDSGISSGHTELPRRKGSDVFLPPKETGDTNSTTVKSDIPWEIFLTARKFVTRFYMGSTRERRPSRIKQARSTTSVILPVMQFEVVHPAVTLNAPAQHPGLRLQCYDVKVHGRSNDRDWVCRAVPEASDYTTEWFLARLGEPDHHTGVLPSLLTVDVKYSNNVPATVSVDLGRPMHVSFNFCILSDLSVFLDGIAIESNSSDTAPESPPISKTTGSPSIAVSGVSVRTREITVEVATASHSSEPTIILSVADTRMDGKVKNVMQGTTSPRIDANLMVEGLEVSLLLERRSLFLVKPFAFTSEIEMVFSPHSLSGAVPSLPHVFTRLDVGLIQIDVGQEHLRCINLFSEFLHQYFEQNGKHDNRGVRKEFTDERCVSDDARPANSEGVCGSQVRQSHDDLRTGPFKYVTVSGDGDLIHAEPYEILFTSDSRDKPPTMVWRYPEPRALSAVEVLPLPITSPVLVNTINMGDELQVPCVLSYWDNAQRCYIMYKEFFLSETTSCKIALPDPITADPATVVIADEWQMVVDVSVDIDYPEESSACEGDGSSSYSSPYRSLINATSLAASVKVNSVFSPFLIPAISAQITLSSLELKLLTHNSAQQVLPSCLDGYTLDSSLPPEQEFLLLTLERMNGMVKHLGGKGAASLAQLECTCRCDLLDYGDLMYNPLLSPFNVNLTTALFHDLEVNPSDKLGSLARPYWLECALDMSDILVHVSQRTVHTAALAISAWTRPKEMSVLSHYIICNDTNEGIRLGQVDTDESLLLSSRHVLPYSWRSPRSVALDPRLHVCIEAEGDWRWSEPFDIDNTGVCARTIHHKLHSATLYIEVRPLSGVQKQVVIRGGLQINSRLSVGMDIQILKNLSLATNDTTASAYQVSEDASLAPHTTLPSYIVSHAGLVGMRIRIPNCTTWSEALPLEPASDSAGTSTHLIVKLLGVKNFQTYFLWYSVNKTMFEQTQVTLSPLFVMRSHLPEPVLMNVLTANTSMTSSLNVIGRGVEEEILSLEPNTWHHLTFRFTSGGKMSDPSVPLNSTLIDLANKVNPDACDDVETPLDKIWPYCRPNQPKQEALFSQSSEGPLVRYITTQGALTHGTITSGTGTSGTSTSGTFASGTSTSGNYTSGIDTSGTGTSGTGNQAKATLVPNIEVQCRVVKKWRDLSTLLIDILPWCLLVNNTSSTLYVRDLDNGVCIEIPSTRTLAPHRFKNNIQFGVTFPGTETISWSEPQAFTTNQESKSTGPNKDDSTSDSSHHVAFSIAHVTKSGQPIAAQCLMTSQTRHGVLVASIEEQFCILNQTGRDLKVYAALASTGKKVSTELLSTLCTIHVSCYKNQRVAIPAWEVTSTSAVVLDANGNALLGKTTPLLFFSLEQDKPVMTSGQTGVMNLENAEQSLSDEAKLKHSPIRQTAELDTLEQNKSVMKSDQTGMRNLVENAEQRLSDEAQLRVSPIRQTAELETLEQDTAVIETCQTDSQVTEDDVNSVVRQAPQLNSPLSQHSPCWTGRDNILKPRWSPPVLVSSETVRSMVGVPTDNTTIPLVLTTQVHEGVVNIVVAIDSSPRFLFKNECPYTLQFGQATPPQSPSYRRGSPERIVVVEQLDHLYDVPEVGAFSSMYYELPVVKEWFKTSSDLQLYPELHIQGLYNVTVAEISEELEAQIQAGTPTEVPQGWSHGFDINNPGQQVVNLPGRGRVIVFITQSRLCTTLEVSPFDERELCNRDFSHPEIASTIDCEISVTQVGISVSDELQNVKKPYEIVRATVEGIRLKHSLCPATDNNIQTRPELLLAIKSFQLDNQLEDDLYEFSVVALPSSKLSMDAPMPSESSPRGAKRKPLVEVKFQYEDDSSYIHVVNVSIDPLTFYIEDTLIYRIATLLESFLPPHMEFRQPDDTTADFDSTRTILDSANPTLFPLMVGSLRIEPISIQLTLHGSVKLFVAMDDTPLTFGEFQISPVFAPSSSLAQKVFYHYLSAAVFKVGWLLGSLELLGSPAGLVRSFSQGLADFFYLPYDGLTRGPGAFVSGMSRGMSSFVRHFSTGTLTSVTNLATSISRNLDRLCMDEQHSRILEEQRCRRPTRLITGLTQGLSGFGLSLLGAVAGVVDQPIQGIQRASDMKGAASGVISGFGKGLLGIVTKPLGGAMELVSQTGQGILQGTGLSRLPTRLHPVGKALVTNARNTSHLKYLWKVLHFRSERNLLLHVGATVVTSSGHDYSGAILLTPNTLYIVSLSPDTIQQTLNLRDTDLKADQNDNRSVVITTQCTCLVDDDVTSIPDTGDPERMKQFLRDAHTFARASRGESADSPASVYSSHFVVILEPSIRQAVISQFRTAKVKCVAETQL